MLCYYYNIPGFDFAYKYSLLIVTQNVGSNYTLLEKVTLEVLRQNATCKNDLNTGPNPLRREVPLRINPINMRVRVKFWVTAPSG